jgi:hypothetical protein
MKRTQIVKLAIKLNHSDQPSACPICGRQAPPTIGPDLTLAGDERIVCRTCGRVYAPSLVKLLELAEAAERYQWALQPILDDYNVEVESQWVKLDTPA